MPEEILSIQSHVAYGYVGNRAAVFPLQRLGFDVTAINTVQFSNHTGYGSWQGDVMSADHIKHLIQGLRDLKRLSHYVAVLSGYLGDVALGKIILETVAEIRKLNPDVIYCCDPVMGDKDTGCFVKPDLPDFFKHHVLSQADIITPNQFEAEYLAGTKISTLKDAATTCDKLLKAGPKIVLLTSLQTEDTASDEIQMLACTADHKYLVTTPKFIFDIQPSGAGDITAAIFVADYYRHRNVERALTHVAASVFAIFKRTYEQKTRELQLIAAQDEIIHPTKSFSVVNYQN